MSKRALGDLNSYEKFYVLWTAASAVVGIVASLVGFKPSWAWLLGWGFVTLFIIEEIWNKKTSDLNSRIENLEDRISKLERHD